MSAPAVDTRKITQEELPVIFALNYATMTCIHQKRFDDAEAINSDTIAIYGRLLPALVCRYSLRVAAGNLDAIGSLKALADVFTPIERAHPSINFVRLILIVTGLAKDPGYERQRASAISELRVIAEDPDQAHAIRERAAALVAEAGHAHVRAA